MEVSGGEEEGFIREWTPCSHMLSLIPPRVQNGLFSNELYLTCIDAVSEYIALGTNIGMVYWYDRKKGNIQRLRCEVATSAITFVKIVSTVDYMVAAGNTAGQVTVFQIPKQHPENVPDTFKPKVQPKVERYTIGDLHKSRITAIEWSRNGMRLFSGDETGVIIMTEIDFYMNGMKINVRKTKVMVLKRDEALTECKIKIEGENVEQHLCKSMEIVNEEHAIVQLSYCQNTLLVSSWYRSIVCERQDTKWSVSQVGKKERRSLCPLGAVFQYSYAQGGAPAAYCARPGLRLWRADKSGDVQQTLLFKEAVSNPLTITELLNPALKRHSHQDKEYNFGPLHVFKEQFLVSHNEDVLYVLDPRSLTAVAVVDHLRKILSVSVNKDEILVLEGPRSVLRLGHAPEPGGVLAEEPVNLMTRSLTSSIQQAVNTVRDQTVPFISSVLEQPITLLTNNEFLERGTVANAEECFELPPIKHLPLDISENVLESIINEFKDVSRETEELRRIKSEELQKKLKLYNSIMEKQHDGELIHSSRRSRKKESGAGSGGSTPRFSTPVRKLEKAGDGVSYTSPCVMNMSVYGNITQETDDILEKQIEEKEKILAKMLNIDSLSIKTANVQEFEAEIASDAPPAIFKTNFDQPVTETPQPLPKLVNNDKPKILHKKEPSNPMDLVPKLVQLPWNLGNIELKLEMPRNGVKDGGQIVSPDEHLESEWEFV